MQVAAAAAAGTNVVAPGLACQSTQDVGNVLVSTTAWMPGQVLVEDSALVHANWDDDRCFACDESHASQSCSKVQFFLPRSLLDNLSQIETHLIEIEAVGELDRARMLIKTIVHCTTQPTSPLADLIRALTVANPERYELATEAICQDSVLAPLVSYTDKSTIARVLGVLNTNSHELEDLGGSGLFAIASLCQHSCLPNCSFSTQGTTLLLTAIAPIAAGDRLCLDYGNFLYTCTKERQSELQASYGFICACSACTVLPDRTRAFQCPLDRSDGTSTDATERHAICPTGVQGEHKWSCFKCKFSPARDVVNKYLEQEKYLENSPPTSLADVEGVVSQGLCLMEHHLIFRAIEHLARGWLEMDGPTSDEMQAMGLAGADAKRTLVPKVWERITKCVEFVSPQPNSEKVIYWDQLGQVKVKFADVAGAREAFDRAFRLSETVSGGADRAKGTRLLKMMVDDTPTTVEQLVARYNNN